MFPTDRLVTDESPLVDRSQPDGYEQDKDILGRGADVDEEQRAQ